MGLGWEVWLNGMEVSQFTYFQQAGGLEVFSDWRNHLWARKNSNVSPNVDNVYDLIWTESPKIL